METFLFKALQLLAALAILVLFHEFGHYFFARVFGIKVERFYLFFNPWFTLVKYRPKEKKWIFFKRNTPDTPNEEDNQNQPVKTSWKDTEYGIGWLPLGGYASIAGMIDETQGAEQLAKEPQPWEFRSKPAWQRFLVIIGGVLFNFILAILIYTGIAFYWGEKTIAFENATEGLDYVEAAQKAGFQNGDIPLLADGAKIDIKDRDHAYKMVNAKVVTVLRNKKDTVNISIPDDFIFRLNEDEGFFAYRTPVYVQKLSPGEPAEKAGLKEGDHIIGVGTDATPAFSEFTPALKKYAGKEVKINVMRGDSLITLNITPSENGKIGIQLKPITDIYPVDIEKYSFFEAFPKGWEIGTTTLATYVSSMKQIFSKEGAQSIGGFGSLGSIFPETWNWRSFWEITAFISLALAFLNFLPIPALDGGYILFILVEVITRRKPSIKFLEYANTIGWLFLIALLLFANGNDIYRAFFK